MNVMAIRFSVLSLFVLSGCIDGDFSKQPNEEKIATSIWSLYGCTHARPEIGWRMPSCGPKIDYSWWDGPVIDHSGFDDAGDCVDGFFKNDPDYINIAWRGRVSFSSIAHELLHAALYYEGHDDQNHERDEWRTIEPEAESIALRIDGITRFSDNHL